MKIYKLAINFTENREDLENPFLSFMNQLADMIMKEVGMQESEEERVPYKQPGYETQDINRIQDYQKSITKNEFFYGLASQIANYCNMLFKDLYFAVDKYGEDYIMNDIGNIVLSYLRNSLGTLDFKDWPFDPSIITSTKMNVFIDDVYRAYREENMQPLDFILGKFREAGVID